MAAGAGAGAGARAAEATETAARIGAGAGVPTSPQHDPQRPPGRGGPVDSRRTAGRWPIAVASAAVAAAIVAVGFGVLALRSHSPGSPAAVSSSHDSQTVTSSPDPAPSSTSTPTASASQTPLPTTNANSTPANPAPTGPDDIWIAQLDSVKVSSGVAALDATLAKVRLEIPGAQVLTSSDYASLGTGFWVIYYAGSFTNGNQALAYCAAHGRTTKHLCLGRFLSHNIADKHYQCYPPASNSSPNCDRP